jgi:hypothetical protein
MPLAPVDACIFDAYGTPLKLRDRSELPGVLAA